ncbi:MAG: FimD/PapC N-terminal domain-containing protein, partial [Enterobacteriaceae bacterium]
MYYANRWLLYFNLLLYSAATLSGSLAAHAETTAVDDNPDTRIEFDPSTLLQRGIDPRIAAQLGAKPQFAPGDNQIILFINGVRKGSGVARFNSQGQICFNQSFADWAGLNIPSRAATESATTDSEPCPLIEHYYPQAVVTMVPQEGKVDLLMPTEALRRAQQQIGDYQTGGWAGLLNYDILTMQSHYSQGNSRYLQASTELGANFNDWMLRSRQSFSVVDGQRNSQYLYTWLQKTWVKYRTT